MRGTDRGGSPLTLPVRRRRHVESVAVSRAFRAALWNSVTQVSRRFALRAGPLAHLTVSATGTIIQGELATAPLTPRASACGGYPSLDPESHLKVGLGGTPCPPFIGLLVSPVDVEVLELQEDLGSGFAAARVNTIELTAREHLLIYAYETPRGTIRHQRSALLSERSSVIFRIQLIGPEALVSRAGPQAKADPSALPIVF